jgi:acyl-CoA synthetase (NDP forming)
MPTGNEPAVSLEGLLEPRSIAIIGASDQPGSLGGRAVQLLQKFGFPGPIWPVNPRRAEVAGLPCYPSVSKLPGRAELAIIAVGASTVARVVEECAAAGIMNGIVWAAGFAEIGGEGVALQQELANVCRATGFRLCGPNSIGIINSTQPMTGTFASSLVSAQRLVPGNVSMVSQSGGLGTAAFSLAQQSGFGFRYLISTGNEAVLTASDFLSALTTDAKTKVIAAYLEGASDGAAFVAASERARAAGKPFVVLKAGSSAASSRAAKAHTGALAGEDRVWQAIFQEQAAIVVESNLELVEVTLALSTLEWEQLPRGNRVAIITFGGGGGVLSADLCVRYGLELPSLGAATAERLASLLPPIASTVNPVDMTPDMFQAQWLAKLPEVIDAVASDPGVDLLFLPLSAMARGAADVARAVLGYHRSKRKPLFVSWTLAAQESVDTLAEGGFYAFPEPSRAIRVMGKIASHVQTPVRQPEPVSTMEFDWNAFVPSPKAGQVISEDGCLRILKAAGLAVPSARLVRSEEEAIDGANTVGYPVVLKGISPQVTHRAAAGLLALDLRTDAEVAAANRELTARAAALNVELDGILVEHMIPGRLELLISAFRDPIFGVMVVCGAGGNLAELMDDVTLERAPFGVARAVEVLKRLKIVQRAERIDRAANVNAAAEFASQLSRLAASAPWKRFVIELNPIKWSGHPATAVDGLLIIEEP